jgi:MFS transporter, DHA3 family, macrolide efflux protein
LACILVPSLFGTGFAQVVLLIFALNVLGQVSGPAEQALAPIVAPESQLASANSLFGLSSNAGTLFGTGLLAPVVVITFGLRAVFVIAGVMLVFAAQRVLGARGTPLVSQRATRRTPLGREEAARQWLVREPAVASMVGLAVLSGVASVVLQVLAPQYVVDVIGVDAESAVYVFAPSTFGVILALGAAPFLIRVAGERRCAMAALLLTASTLVALGFVRNSLAAVVDPINPLRGLGVVGLGLGAKLRTAGLLAVPLGFGVSLTTTAVQTYINRRTPVELQGRVFAVQSTLKNGAAIVPLLTLGGIASLIGVADVLVVAPAFLVAVGAVLLLVAGRYIDALPDTPREFASALLAQETETEGTPESTSGPV